MGTLSALPFINLGNCCCLWLIGGGVVAAYVLQQNQEAPITPGDGALAGLFAGIVGACIFLVLSIPIAMVMAPMQRAMMERVINESGNNIPPEFRQFLTSLMSGPLQVVFGFVFTLVFGAIFSTLGGLLGVSIFKKEMHTSAQDAP